MTFLAPWALALGGLGAAGLVLLHLVARQRPAAYVLPTTRFIPDQRTLVSRAATRPRDLLLLALRVLMLLAAAAAFARPVLTPSRGAVGRVVLLDRSRAVADPADALRRARAAADSGASVVVVFDSAARVIAGDSVGGSEAVGSLSAALVAARRAGVGLAQRVDSVELVLVSPVAANELDAATMRVRAEWPGAIRLERVALRADSAGTWQLDRPVSLDDPLGPALTRVRGAAGAHSARLVRGKLTAGDSAFARGGGTVVVWDSATGGKFAAEGLSVHDDVIVAPLARLRLPADGRVIARWADGSPAALEGALGQGCIRSVGVGVPAAGDLALDPAFQRIVRSLFTPCGVRAADTPADSASIAKLVGTSRAAADAGVLRKGSDLPSPLAPWLLGLALALALGELAARTMLPPEIA